MSADMRVVGAPGRGGGDMCGVGTPGRRITAAEEVLNEATRLVDYANDVANRLDAKTSMLRIARPVEACPSPATSELPPYFAGLRNALERIGSVLHAIDLIAEEIDA